MPFGDSVTAFLVGALETLFSPLARASPDHHGEAIRFLHVQTVERMISERKGFKKLSFLSRQVYWTLYLGLLAVWAADESPNHEDTMAMVDHSMQLFVLSLGRSQRRPALSRRKAKK